MRVGALRAWKPTAVGYTAMTCNEEPAKAALSTARSVQSLLAIPAFRHFVTGCFRSPFPPRYEETFDPEDDSVVRSLVVHTSLSVDDAFEARARLGKTLRSADRNELLQGIAISLRFAE